MFSEEVWKSVPSRPGLEASSHGRIRIQGKTAPTFGVITTSSKTAQHRYFGRHIKGVGNIKVHRAVCEAFHGAAESASMVVLHLNENALDNRPGNLRWGTQRENLNAPKFLAYCRARTGENNPHRKGRAIAALYPP